MQQNHVCSRWRMQVQRNTVRLVRIALHMQVFLMVVQQEANPTSHYNYFPGWECMRPPGPERMRPPGPDRMRPPGPERMRPLGPELRHP